MVNYIHFSSGIDDEKIHELLRSVADCIQNGDPDVYLLLNSTGGGVWSGYHGYNMLRSLSLNLTVHNVGVVNSVANIIFLAGDRRYASPCSYFKFHSAGWHLKDGARLEATRAKAAVDALTADNDTMAAALADRTSLPPEEIGQLFFRDVVRTTEWALEFGLIEDVRFPSIPAGATLIHIF